MLTTKYPIGVVLTELAAQAHLRGMILRGPLIPRLQNEKADALSDFEFESFDVRLRIKTEGDDVVQMKLPFFFLNDLFDVGNLHLRVGDHPA